MTIRRFYSNHRAVLFSLTLFLFLPFINWGQSETIYEEGRISEALYASMKPDNRTVGVYLTVAKENELSPQEWASTVEKYFKAYGFPVKIILDNQRPEGKGAVALIYVGAKAYNGNLSSRGVSLYHLLKEHKAVFSDLLALYKEANPDLFTSTN